MRDSLETLKMLTQVYGEIASARMKRTRESVLKNREFMVGISDLFMDVKANYTKGEKITFLAHNGKNVAIFLSANTGLYGGILQETFGEFLKEVKNEGSEATIIGKLGLSLFLSELPNHPYTYFDLPDDKVIPKTLLPIIRHLVEYEEIHVHYGKFQSALAQSPTMFSIKAGTSLPQSERKEKVQYFFEPDLETVLQIFEKEIFASLFEQTVKESLLAKFSARITAMEEAGENISDDLKKIYTQEIRLKHRISNKKQINSTAAISLLK